MPGGTNALAGVIRRSGDEVTFAPERGSSVQLVDSTKLLPIGSTLKLESDRSRNATVLASGSLRLRVHEEPDSDRLWLRVWDEEHPARATFELPQSHALDTAWRLAARLDRFDSTRSFEVSDVANGTQVFRSPGTLAFQVGGREHRLVAFADSNSTSLFIMLWDSTAITTTYQAGRYLRTPLPIRPVGPCSTSIAPTTRRACSRLTPPVRFNPGRTGCHLRSRLARCG